MTVTPASSSCEKSRDRIIASALLLITISSKQSNLASAAIALATGGIGSPSSFARSARSRSCTSSMNSWKWTRRFGWWSIVSKGEVHQHGLAAPDPAPEIGAGRRRLRAPGETPEEAALGRGGGELLGEAVEHRDGALLVGVGLELAGARRAPGSARRARSRGLAGLAQRAGEGGDQLALLHHLAGEEGEPLRLAQAARPRRRAGRRSGPGTGSGPSNRASPPGSRRRRRAGRRRRRPCR